MTVVAFIGVVICMTFVPGCSLGKKSATATGPETQVLPPAPDGTKKADPGLLEVQSFCLTEESLRLDYLVHNPFDHDIWICDDLDIRSKNRVSERDAATRITDGTLWIRLHEHLEWNFFGDPIFARYRRVPSGNSVSENLLLPVPVTNDSPLYTYGHRDDVRTIAHRVVFELGYFEEDLPSLLSQWGDANAVLISDWWDRLDLERITQVVIADVNVPVMAH